MFINRIHFENVKSLTLEIPVGEGLADFSGRRRLLIQGGNGSGKTTLLESIADLWQFWGEWIDLGEETAPPRHQARHYLASATIAAIEVQEVAAELPLLWIGVGGSLGWSRLRAAYPDHAFSGLERIGNRLRMIQKNVSGLDLKVLRNEALLGSSTGLQTHRKSRAPSGTQVLESHPIPNVVYFPPDNRTIQKQKMPRAVLLDSIPYNWVARFDQKVNLDSVLLTLKTREPAQYGECLRFVNLALSHRRKQITGFGENGRLVVEGESAEGARYLHTIDELSSGEKQILLMIGFTTAFLRPGGILLLDEPDLHIHVSMVSQLMETLELICDERQAQWIVASHSSSVWDWFDQEERVDLSGWREGQS